MENQTPSQTGAELDSLFNISFDITAIDHLKQLSLWAKVTSVCAFIGYIFSLAAAFFARPVVPALTDENTAAVVTVAKTSTILGTFLVVIIGGAINYFLYRFAVVVGQGARRMDKLKVNSGFDSLRIYFKIIGILLIIGLSIFGLGLLISILSGSHVI